jgi:hypothetical protein
MGKTKKPSLLSQQNYYFVAEGGLFHDPFCVTAQRNSPASACGVCRGFLFLSLA